MLGKLKNWIKRQNDVTVKKLKDTEEKQHQKTKDKLDKMLIAEGFSKATAKGSFIGSNNASKTYPTFNLNYVGGYYDNPEGKDDIKVIIIPQGIMFSHLVKNDIIPFSEIKSVTYKTWEQLNKDVTLTRLLAFGGYAFAMKKIRKTTVKYTVLKCNHNGMDYAVMFSDGQASQFYSDMFKILTTYQEG